MVDDTRTMYWTLQLAFIMALIAAMTMPQPVPQCSPSEFRGVCH
jgi:hypothetical protein